MSLKQELKLNGDFASLEQETLLSLTRTVSVIEPAFIALFNEAGVTSQQFNVLRILNGHKGDEGMPCSEIASRMIHRDSDVTRLIDKLEKLGLAKRERPDYDRRKVLVSITQVGKQLIKKIMPKVDKIERQSVGHLKVDELKNLILLLEKIREPYL